MKKGFKAFLITWLVVFAVFNAVVFVLNSKMGVYDGQFWTGYAFITLSFIGELICGYFALKGSEARKTFYNFSLLKTSYTCFITSVIVGGMCLLVKFIPTFVGIIICLLVLALEILAIIKTATAVEIASEKDDKIKSSTGFIKEMTVNAESLIGYAKTEEVKAECKKIYEAIRYSDPVSSNNLCGLEKEIAELFQNFETAVKNGSDTQEISTKLLNVLNERNKKLKALK